MKSPYSEPTVSIVVPTFNSESFVVETINSVLSQTFTDFELIISDHESTDGTWELISQFTDPRIRRLRTPRTAGPEQNWNVGTAAASGRYLKLVCADDVLHPQCLEQQVEAMQSHPGAVMVASRRAVVTRGGQVVLPAWGLPHSVGEFSGPDIVRRAVRAGTNIFGEPACVLLCRATLDMVGRWDGGYPYVLDQHTYSKVLMHGTFVGIAEPLASFRLSDTQWSIVLARGQLQQVTEFYRSLGRAYPGILSRKDLLRGRWRATAITAGRRLSYLWLRRKLRAPDRALRGLNAPTTTPAADIRFGL